MARDRLPQLRRPAASADTPAAAAARPRGSPAPEVLDERAPVGTAASAGTPRSTPSASRPQTALGRTSTGTRCTASGSRLRSSPRRTGPKPPAPRAPQWITIPPPSPGGQRRQMDHDLAAGWITVRPPLKRSGAQAAPVWRSQVSMGSGLATPLGIARSGPRRCTANSPSSAPLSPQAGKPSARRPVRRRVGASRLQLT